MLNILKLRLTSMKYSRALFSSHRRILFDSYILVVEWYVPVFSVWFMLRLSGRVDYMVGT